MKFTKGFVFILGLAAGESDNVMSVQHLSKLAMQCFPATSGRKLGWISLASNFFQLIALNHLCRLISSLPKGPLPRRLLASLLRSYNKTKQVHLALLVSDEHHN